MRAADPDTLSRTRRLPDVGATARLAEALSEHVRRGDVIGLAGALGIGTKVSCVLPAGDSEEVEDLRIGTG